MSTRTDTHIIDTRTIKNVIGVFPDHWVIRELTERDYGIDLQVEIFKKESSTKYSSTGCLLNLQVKGTNKKKTEKVTHKFTHKHLEYFNNFPIPTIILKVFNQFKNETHSAEIFYVWVQKYIEYELDVQDEDWRTKVQYYKKGKNKGKTKTNTIKIKFPEENVLKSEASFKRLEEFAFRPKYFVELKEFVEAYNCMKTLIDDYKSLDGSNSKELVFLQSWIRRTRYFSALLTHNDCQVNKETIIKLESFLIEFKFGSLNSDDFENLEYKSDLDRLCEVAGNYYSEVEKSMSDISRQKPY